MFNDEVAPWGRMLIRWRADPNFRIPESLSADAPAVFTTVQVARVHPSTAVRLVIEHVEQGADSGQKGAAGIRYALDHAGPAVAGTGPPLSTDTHFWIAPVSTTTASTSKIELQMVSTQPSVWRAALTPTAIG